MLFLDEPTIGLDLVVKEKILKAIKELNQTHKTTVILTTHDMGDIEELCGRIIIIDKGKLVYDGSIGAIKNRYGWYKVLEVEARDWDGFEELLPGKAVIPGNIEKEGMKIRIPYDSRIIRGGELLSVLMRKIKVLDMRIHERSIEDIVKEIYRENSHGHSL